MCAPNLRGAPVLTFKVSGVDLYARNRAEHGKPSDAAENGMPVHASPLRTPTKHVRTICDGRVRSFGIKYVSAFTVSGRKLSTGLAPSSMSRSCHDYNYLMQRWRCVARAARLRVRSVATVDGFPVYCLRSPALSERGGLYLSAGIHGDEPASTEGLLAWAQRFQSSIRYLPVMIFPCLNPWGLVMNSRFDAGGNDVNRAFHGDHHPTAAAVRQIAGPHLFDAAMLLHEDYDAQGLYLYELSRELSIGGAILRAAAAALPIDPRTRVEGRRLKDGVLRPRVLPRRFAKMGHPEAVWLYSLGCRRTITFETPSEAALELRTEAHERAVARMLDLVITSSR